MKKTVMYEGILFIDVQSTPDRSIELSEEEILQAMLKGLEKACDEYRLNAGPFTSMTTLEKISGGERIRVTLNWKER